MGLHSNDVCTIYCVPALLAKVLKLQDETNVATKCGVSSSYLIKKEWRDHWYNMVIEIDYKDQAMVNTVCGM